MNDKYSIEKNRFEDIVGVVVSEYKDKPLKEVNEIVERVCEEYVMKYGKKPDSYQLSLLANVILQEDLKNPSKYKSKEEEYPFHSDTQRKRRRKKEFTAMDETLDHMKFKSKVNLSTAPPKDIKI